MQPLVENAIKHGLSGRIGSTLLRISAHVEPGKAPKLVLDVEDDGAGLQSNPLTQTASGVGLRNIVSRLRFLYGDNAAFFLTPRLPNGARARVELPLER
jgi:two-component system LytT family sensor kinase